MCVQPSWLISSRCPDVHSCELPQKEPTCYDCLADVGSSTSMEGAAAPTPRALGDTLGNMVPWSWTTDKPKKVRFDLQVSVTQPPVEITEKSSASTVSEA